VDLCTGRGLTLSGEFVAHSGATASASAPLEVEGCPPGLSASVRSLGAGRPVVSLKVTRSDAPLRSAVFTLPRGLRFQKAAMNRGASAVAGSRRLSFRALRISRNGRTLSVSRLPGVTADTLRVVLRRGAVASDARLRKAARRKPSLTFAASVVDANLAKFAVKRTVRGR
jgi:hypothetical protein